MQTAEEIDAPSNEERILRESAIEGERALAALRLLMGGVRFVTLSSVAIATTGMSRDPVRGLLVGGNIVYSLGLAWLFWRTSSPLKRARWLPYAITFIDFAISTALMLRRQHATIPTPAELPTLAFTMLLCFSALRFNLRNVALSTGLACVCYVLVSSVQRVSSTYALVYVLMSYSLLGLLVGWGSRQLRRMLVDLRRRDALTRLLPAPVVDRLLRQGEEALAPANREVTVLFSDIRGFTHSSERQEPSKVLQFLDQYLGRMGRIVKANGGMVNKFLGDGLLAVWGAPDEQQDHAKRALEAALAMRAEVDAINVERRAAGLEPLRIGLGIHSGMVAAGMLGGSDQREYAVIGDAVNLASRLEGLTKEHHSDVLVSAQAWEQGGAGFAGEPLGPQRVRGREEPVVIYALRGRATP